MTIDITKLKEDALLPQLGEGDWVIAMPERYSDLRVSAQWRGEILTWAGMRYVSWVLKGIHYEMDHDNDPPWDHSGEVLRQQADPLILRSLYNTLDGWLKDEYTGQWEPTFEPRAGRSWQTYIDIIEEHIRERLSDLLHTQYDDLFDDPDDFNDTIYEEADLVIFSVELALLLMVGQLGTNTAYKRFEAPTRQALEEEERQSAQRAAHYERLHALTRHFWEAYFPDAQQIRIEQPQFKEMRLAERLREILADADPALIEAIVEVGLPGMFSNTVGEAIKNIARNALQ